MAEEIFNEELLDKIGEIEQIAEKEQQGDKSFLSNLDLILNVPLQVSVQIGGAKKTIKEVMEFKQGTIIELNKLAGEQADVLVNGKCFAKGDIVIIDDNFCVRITEIVGNNSMYKRY